MNQPQGVQLSQKRTNPWIILVVICLSFFLVSLDTSIVNIAIPSILANLHASLDQLLWVVNAYLIVFTALLITSGRLGDLFGQRTMILLGIALFILSSAASGLSQNGIQLICARIGQGIGAALLTPQTLAIIFVTFSRDKLGSVFGIYGAIASFAAVVGPTVGGIIVTTLGWRWIFFVNVPIGIIAIVATILLVPDIKTARRHRLDIVGVILATSSLFAIAFGLIEGQRYSWGTIISFIAIPEIIIVGVLLGAAFILWERRQEEPLIPLRLFTDRNYSLMNVVSAALFFSQYGLAITAVLYLQWTLGLSPLQAGFTYFPLALMSMIIAPLAGRLADRIGGKPLVITGLSLYALAILTFALVASLNTPWWVLVPIFAIGGTGVGCTFPPVSSIALRNIDVRLAGAASGVMNTSRQLGGVMGSSIIGAILQSVLASNLNNMAITQAGQLPASLRTTFVNTVAQIAAKGLQIGSPEGGTAFPTSAGLTQQVQVLYHDIVVNSYLQALRPTLIVPVVVLFICALSCLTIQSARTRTQKESYAQAAPKRDSAAAENG